MKPLRGQVLKESREWESNFIEHWIQQSLIKVYKMIVNSDFSFQVIEESQSQLFSLNLEAFIRSTLNRRIIDLSKLSYFFKFPFLKTLEYFIVISYSWIFQISCTIVHQSIVTIMIYREYFWVWGLWLIDYFHKKLFFLEGITVRGFSSSEKSHKSSKFCRKKH